MSRAFLGAFLVCAAVSPLASANTDHALTPPGLPPANQAIVGGSDVPEGKWPDTVAVLGDTGVCTGTLIAPDVVLTAGHCAGINPRNVVANTTDYSRTGGARSVVARTVAYPNWENTYDVAVIVLQAPITAVVPRRMGTSCTFSGFASSTSVRLVGFGATDMEGATSNTVLKEAMTAVTDPLCNSGNGCNTIVAPGGEFIAGGGGTADSCFGDSGGPVYLDTGRGPVVIGAVSRGVNNAATPCGGGGIYVRTDKIVEWIEETAGRAVMKDECDGDERMGTGEEDEEADEVGGCSATGASSGSLLSFGVLAFGLAFARRRRGSIAATA